MIKICKIKRYFFVHPEFGLLADSDDLKEVMDVVIDKSDPAEPHTLKVFEQCQCCVRAVAIFCPKCGEFIIVDHEIPDSTKGGE